jgi:hypothetical protein
MARSITQAWLRNQARQLADEVDTVFITDATANEWINQSYARLRDLLVDANPDWLIAKYPLYTTSGTLEYDLPDDFYQIRGVDMFQGVIGDPSDDEASNVALMEAERYDPIEQFNFLDRGRGQEVWPPPRWTAEASVIRYRVIQTDLNYQAGVTTQGHNDEKIRFEPDPGTRSFRIWYVPVAVQLATDGSDDAVEINGINGYEDYIIAAVAERMMIKAETDPSGPIRLRQEAESRITRMAGRRDQGRPVQVADTRHRRFYR